MTIKMANFNCPCFNVSIDVRPGQVTAVSPSVLNQLKESDPFVKQGIKQVHLSLGGVFIQQPLLIRKRLQNKWNIYRCLNCNIATHALPVAYDGSFPEDHVIVSVEVLKNTVTKKEIEKSKDYSALFKILLKGSGLSENVEGADLPEETSKTIDDKVQTYIRETEAAMNHDIRIYGERRYFKMMQDQQHAVKDAEEIRSLLSSAFLPDEKKDGNIETAASSTTADQPKVSALSLTDEPFKTPDKVPPLKPIRSLSLAGMGTSRRIKNPQNRPAKTMPDSSAEEGIFWLDEYPEFHFPQLTSADSTDSDSDESDTSFVFKPFASSMPVEVPKPSPCRPPFQAQPNAQDGAAAPMEPSDIGASIKELARAAREDGREVFGDLPKSRSYAFS